MTVFSLSVEDDPSAPSDSAFPAFLSCRGCGQLLGDTPLGAGFDLGTCCAIYHFDSIIIYYVTLGGCWVDTYLYTVREFVERDFTAVTLVCFLLCFNIWFLNEVIHS